MHKELFSPEHGARKGVPYICILLTDGFSANRIRTLQEAAEAKGDGITIIAIGVGQVFHSSVYFTLLKIEWSLRAECKWALRSHHFLNN